MKKLILIGFLAIACLCLGLLLSCNCHNKKSGGDDDAGYNNAGDDDNSAESVWTDPLTGMMWQNGPTIGTEAALSRANAQSYCANLRWAGFKDWRLPDIDVLRGLIRGCAVTQTGGPCAVTGKCLDDTCWNNECNGCSDLGGQGLRGAYWPPELSGNVEWYWSSSDNAGNGFGVNFPAAKVDRAALEEIHHVRCVRTPESAAPKNTGTGK